MKFEGDTQLLEGIKTHLVVVENELKIVFPKYATIIESDAFVVKINADSSLLGIFKSIGLGSTAMTWTDESIHVDTLLFKYLDSKARAALIGHELYHILDMWRKGRIRYIIQYAVNFPFKGRGNKHPLEKNAYAFQSRLKSLFE